MVTPFKILLVVLIGNFCEGSATCPDTAEPFTIPDCYEKYREPNGDNITLHMKRYEWSRDPTLSLGDCPSITSLLAFQTDQKPPEPNHFWPSF